MLFISLVASVPSALGAIPEPYSWYIGHVNMTKRVSLSFSVEPDGSIEPYISFMVPAKTHCTGGLIGDAGAIALYPNRTLGVRRDGRFAGSGSSTFPDESLRIVAHWRIRGRFTSQRIVRGWLRITQATFGNQQGPRVTARCHGAVARFKLRLDVL